MKRWLSLVALVVSSAGAAAAGPAVSVIDVGAYGARGDGSTDDTAAIQSAINAAASISGTVFFPDTANGYRVTRTLTYTSSSSGLAITLKGAARPGRGAGIG